MIDVKKEGYFLLFQKPNGEEVRYDLKRQVLQRIKNRDWIDVENQYTFFRGEDVHTLNFVDPKFKELINLVKKSYPNCENISSFITKIKHCLIYESFLHEQVPFELRMIRNGGRMERYGVTRPLMEYDKHVIKFWKAHRELFAQREMVITKHFEECYFKDPAKEQALLFALASAEITGDQLVEAMKLIYEHWNYKTKFRVLINNHRCDPKSLIEYVYNYLVPFEGLTFEKAIDNLEDYYNMAQAIGRAVKKYPKYLVSMHDILRANFNTYKKTYDEIMFKNLMKTELTYSDQAYCIILPENSKDVVKEGTSLNHCVSSYVEKILRGETYICFLRLLKEPSESLITLEIKGDRLVQAKGSYNRSMSEEERLFIKKWCNVRKLHCEVL